MRFRPGRQLFAPFVVVAFGVIAATPASSAAPVLSASGPPISLPAAATAAAAAAPDGSLETVSIEPGGGPPAFLFFGTVHLHHFSPDGAPTDEPQTAGEVSGFGHDQGNPVITALPSGGFVVAWETRSSFFHPPISSDSPPQGLGNPDAAGDPFTVSARVLDAAGRPRGSEIQVSANGSLASDARLAALAPGGFVISWIQVGGSPGLLFRRFDATGQPLSDAILAADGSNVRNVGLAALADGGFAAAWGRGIEGFFLQRFDVNGAAVGSPVQVAAPDSGGPSLVAANAAGNLAIAWNTTNPNFQPGGSVQLRVFDLAGNPLAPQIQVAESDAITHPVLAGLAMDLGGRFMVAWNRVLAAGSSNAFAQLFDAAGAPLVETFKVNGPTDGLHAARQVFAAGDGSWQVLWVESRSALLQRYRTDTCAADPGSLCLEANRFRLDVQVRDPRSGKLAAGHPVPLTAETGALWFFGAENPELIVKMLDGTAVNGHHWLFYASLSNVEFDLTVTDTSTGEKRVYHNPAGTLASLADIQAFPLSRAAAPVLHTAEPAAPPPAEAVAELAPRPSPTLCHTLPESLCLTQSRFSVKVAWKDPRSGRSGGGEAVQLYNGGGYFWFFGPSDFELAVKLLDGTAVNGHFWVFYASLTDLEFDLTVTDNSTGASRTYHNPPFHMASAADTESF